MMSPNLLVCGTAAIAGLVSHLTYFIHGEHHNQTPMYFKMLMGGIAIVFASEFLLVARTIMGSLTNTAYIASAYMVPLYTSMLVYRIFFHPLRKFPGPFMYKVSKLWHVLKLIKRNNCHVLEDLHQQYGDFVRTGPNEITIFNTDGMYALHNTTSIFPKAAWYDILLPEIAMSTARDKAVHDQRRRIWDHGFSIKALHLYEGRVTSYAQILESQISKRTGSGINISEWFNWYATDIMGDLAFGRSFDLLSTGKNQADVDLLKKGTPVVGLFLPTPWLFVLLAKMPGPNQEWKQLQGWCYAQLERRLKSKVDVPDIMSWLIEASEAANRLETDMHLLRGDSALIILAGSDTAGAALSSLFYHIVSEPKYLRALREELKTLPSLTDAKALESLPLLNGIVHETLRLHPPTPSGVLRNTPPGGATIGSTFVPGDVTVAVPFYSLGRSEANFVRADEFIPERWFSQPELVKDKLGYVPFSIGQYSCVGKNLALMEMRSVTALLVAKYEISFAPTQLAKQQSFELGLHDHFTSTAAGLDLVFTPLEKHVVVGA